MAKDIPTIFFLLLLFVFYQFSLHDFSQFSGKLQLVWIGVRAVTQTWPWRRRAEKKLCYLFSFTGTRLFENMNFSSTRPN